MTLRLYFGSKICLPTERNKEQKERRPCFSSVQQQDKGQWAQIETQEILSEYEKKLPYCEGGRPLEQLSRDTVESPSLGLFKTHLDIILYNLAWMTLLWQGCWIGWTPGVTSNPTCD